MENLNHVNGAVCFLPPMNQTIACVYMYVYDLKTLKKESVDILMALGCGLQK